MIVLLSGFQLLAAADYYVSPAGNNEGSGKAVQPWRTIQFGCDQLKPGDTLHVMKGTYLEKVQVRVSGRSGSPVTLKADAGAVISGKGVQGDHLLLIENQSHVHVSGFELRDNLKCNDGSGIRVVGACAGIELRNCRIHEIRGKDAMGITVYGTSETPVSDLVIDGCEIFNCDPARSEALTLNGNVAGFRVTNNHVHDVNNIGIDFIGGEEWLTKNPAHVARQGVCKGNRVERCRSNYEGGYAAGIYVDGGRDIVIEDNLVSQCDLGIEVGAENKGTVTSGITVQNNKLMGNDKAGIDFGGYDQNAGRVKGCVFTGNICLKNDRHKESNGELWIQLASDNRITGNIFWCGEEGTLVQVDPGAGANQIDNNQYYSDAGEDGCFFLWRDQDVEGFGAWRKASGQDARSVFAKPALK